MIRKCTALALLLFASCQETDVHVGGDLQSDLQEVMVLPALTNPDLDILFVIDNSQSTLDKQESLAASFPLMMDQLESLDGGLPNVHIGVVTTDMGTTSTTGTQAPGLPGTGGCVDVGDDGVLRHDVVSALGTASFISDVRNSDGTRSQNYTGDLRDVFGELALVGAGGCGFEQPLHSMRRALENPANAGFLRPGANLAVVILADEDDCSFSDAGLLSPDTSQLGPLQSFRCTRFGVTCDQGGATPDEMNTAGPKGGCHSNDTSMLMSDVSSYVDFLVNLKGDPNSVMVAAIAGPSEPFEVELRSPPGSSTTIPAVAHSCSYIGADGPEVADPAVRIADFVAGFPSRSALATICQQDLTTPLTTIGRTAARMMGDPCIGVPIEDTSAEPGFQPRCEVLDGPLGDEKQIPECKPGDTGSCWSVVLDTAKCAGVADNLRLHITRPSEPTSQIYSHLRCKTR